MRRFSVFIWMLFMPCLAMENPLPEQASQEFKRLDHQVQLQREQLARLQKEQRNLQKQSQDLETKVQAETLKFKEELGQLANRNDAARSMIGGLESKTSKQFSLFAFALGGLALGAVGMFYLLRRRDERLGSRLTEARAFLDQETVKLDEKLVDLLSNQMRMLNESAINLDTAQHKSTAIDHSFGLRVGEEIYRMRQRLTTMPVETKGLKPLLKCLERLEEDFTRQGYEVLELLNKPFTDGMVAKTRFIPSDELGIGERIITRVIKPPILYKGVALDLPEIEVSTGG